VVGALGTGYVILPALGSERTFLAVAVVFAGLAAATALQGTPHRLSLALAGTAVVLGVALPRWDVATLTAGTNVYFDRSKAKQELLSVRRTCMAASPP